MMIIEGDITNFPNNCDIIAHGCNNMAIMDSGLALQISNKYPQALTADAEYPTPVGELRLGKYSQCVLPNGKRIINLYQQDLRDVESFDIKAFAKSLNSALKDISGDILTHDQTIALPWGIGGLTEGDFSIVRPLVEGIFERHPYKLIWVKYKQPEINSIIIAGGRDYKFNEDDVLFLENLHNKLKFKEIVSGKARGADTEGELWAEMYNIPIIEFPANWEKFGKKAGFLRNKQMAQYADALVLFKGGNGTKNMFKEAVIENLKIYDRRDT